jgi:hypothetical protein
MEEASHDDQEPGTALRGSQDPRCRGKILHRLEEILVIAVCAVIACAENWEDIELYGRSKLAWFLRLDRGGSPV